MTNVHNNNDTTQQILLDEEIMTSIILPFVISNGDTRVLAEVGSLLKSVFAT